MDQLHGDLMWILFLPKTVKCEACERVTRSRLNRVYQVCFFVSLSITLFLAYMIFHEGMSLGNSYSRRFDILGTLLLSALASTALFFSRNAHSCGNCDSPFVKASD